MPTSFAPRYDQSLRKVADVKLPNNPDMWTDAVYEHISKMHPYLASYLSGDVDWSVDPVDEQEGSATGTVTALIGDRPIQIPIIIRDGRLKEVDLFLNSEGEMDLLDRNIVLDQGSYQTVDVGQTIRYEDGLQSAQGMGNSYFSKVSSYGNFGRDVTRMRAHVESDYPELKESWDRIAKLAGVDRPFDTLSVENSSGQYKVAAFRGGYKLDQFGVSKHAAFSDPNSQIAALARRTRKGDEVISSRPLTKTAQAFTSAFEKTASSFSVGASACVPSDSGNGIEKVKGKVYRVATLQNIEGNDTILMFIGSDNRYSSPLPECAESASGGSAPKTVTVDGLQRGQHYFLLHEGSAVGPMQFLGTSQEDSKQDVLYAFRSLAEGPIGFYTSDRVSKPFGMGGMAEKRAQYLIPTSASFAKIEGELVPLPLHESLSKMASLAEESAAVDVQFDGACYLCKCAGTSVDYRLSENEATAWLMSLGVTQDSAVSALQVAHDTLDKVAVYGVETPTNSDLGEVADTIQKRAQIDRLIETWASARAPITKLAASLSKVADFPEEEEEPEEELPVEEEEAPVQEEMPEEEMPEEEAPEEEAQGQMPEEQAPAQPQAPGMPPQQAAAAGGGTQQQQQTMEQDTMASEGAGGMSSLQDSLNSVNLLNQYNASKFSDATPEIEKAKRSVANLLYRVRTGEIEEIDEEVIKDGLGALDAINRGLSEIASSRSN
jgi:hypothetical protein